MSSLELHANSRQFKFEPLQRIVLVGDIHADPHALINILLFNNLIDEQGRWIAKDTDLVFLGDLIDRGSDSLTTLDLIIHYRKEAEASGCRLHTIIGNHDLMPFEGDFSYMDPEDRLAFKKLGMDTEKEILFLLSDPKLPYAEELRQRQAFIKIGDLGIVHAGLESWVYEYTPDQVNTLFRNYVEALLEKGIRGGSVKGFPKKLFGTNGPHWSRAIVEDSVSEAEFFKFLKGWDIKALAVGHTVTASNRPELYYDHRLIMMDTGISAGMAGQIWTLATTREKLKLLDFEATRLTRQSERVTKILQEFRMTRNKNLLRSRLSTCR